MWRLIMAESEETMDECGLSKPECTESHLPSSELRGLPLDKHLYRYKVNTFIVLHLHEPSCSSWNKPSKV